MKYLIILMFVSTLGVAQTKRVKISEYKSSRIDCSYQMSIDLQNKDTITYLYTGFRNMKYTQLIDISSFLLFDGCNEFADDLRTIIDNCNADANLSITKDKYYISCNDYNNYVTIYSNKDNGYTKLSEKQAKKLFMYLKTIIE